MTYPPLPDPTIIDGRSLYTAGQMREYGTACQGLITEAVIESRVKHNASGQYPSDLDSLRALFGMKP